MRVEVKSRENLAAQQAMDMRQQPRGLRAEKKGSPGERYQSSAALLHQSTKPDSCFLCKEKNHATAACPADISIEEKKRLLRLERRCFRCTKPDHRSNECRCSMQCTKCSRRHATTMCDPGYTPTKAEANRNAITSAPVNLEVHKRSFRASCPSPDCNDLVCRRNQQDVRPSSLGRREPTFVHYKECI